MITERWATSFEELRSRDLASEVSKWLRKRWVPLAAALLFAHIVLLGPFLIADGVPRGGDMAVNLVAGSVAQNGTWHEMWDDTRYPGQSKHVSRFGLGDLALSKLAWLTGDITVGIRLMVWLFHVVAMLGMYLFVSRVTGSRWAGALSALLFVFSTGAPTRAIMAMTAGYALVPLLFYAVDRVMERPGLRNSLVLSLVLALYSTTSIPPFTYIVGLALSVYIAFFVASRSVVAFQQVEDRRNLFRVAAYGALSLLVAVPLAAYFITGLRISTAELLSETGGYDLESLQSGRPSLGEAITFQRGPADMNTTAMYVGGMAFAALAIAAALFVRTWRVLALVTIAFGAVLFASDSPNPLYNFMYDHLPYFSSVRGTRRWTSLTLFGFAASSGFLLAYVIAWTRTRSWQFRVPAHTLRNMVMGLSAALIAVMVFIFSVQVPSIRNWLAPYPLSDEFLAPYEYMQEELPGTVYVPTPFLGKRFKDDDFEIGVAHGKKAGPGISGQPAFGVFQSGGKEVNTGIFDLVSSMKTFPANLFPYEVLGSTPLSMTDRQNRGPRDVKHFFAAGDISFADFGSGSSPIRVQFHRFKNGEDTGFHVVDIHPAIGVIQFKQMIGDSQVLLDSGTTTALESGSFYLEVMSYDDEVGVWIDGEQVISSPLDKYSGADVQLYAPDEHRVTMANGEINIISGTLDSDFSLAGLLSLFKVKYMVVQPNTTEFERQRLAAVPGMTLVEEWGGSQLYLNEYYGAGDAVFSSKYALYGGDGVPLTRALYKLDSVARSKMPLISIDDVPVELREEILAGASFIATDLTNSATENSTNPEELATQSQVSLEHAGSAPPAVYSWDLNSENVILADDDMAGILSLNPGIPIEFARGRDFVFESTVFPSVDTSDNGDFIFRFRIRPDERFYEVRVSPAGAVQLELHRPKNVKLLASGNAAGALNTNYDIRIAAIEDHIRVWVNGDTVLDVSNGTIDKGGPMTVMSTAEGSYIGTRLLVAGDSGIQGLDGLADDGFTFQQISSSSDVIATASIASLGLATAFTAELAAVSQGEYSALLSGFGPIDTGINLVISSDGSSTLVPLTRTEVTNAARTADADNGRWLLVSDPIHLNGGEELLLSADNTEVSFGQILLAESSAGQDVIHTLLSPPDAVKINLDNNRPTQHSGSIETSEPGMLVFQDAYHKSWRATAGGAELPHFVAFGSLNAYWVGADTGNLDDLELVFTSQRRYERGLLISTLSFLLVIAALLAIYFWNRGYRDTRNGIRISALTGRGDRTVRLWWANRGRLVPPRWRDPVRQ